MSTIKLKKSFPANVGPVLLLLVLMVIAACSINAAAKNSEITTNNVGELKPSEAVQIQEAVQAEIVQGEETQVDVTPIEETPVEIIKVNEPRIKVAQVEVAEVKAPKAIEPTIIEPKPSEAELLLKDFMQNAKTLRADFTQVVIDEQGRLDESAASSGVFLLARPGKFRWQVTAPSDLLILADGKNLWNYDVDLEQVTVKPINDTLSSTPAMLLSGETGALDAFKVNGSFVSDSDGQAVQWLELVPVDTHNDFSQLRLGFSEKEIRVMELASNVGQVVRIEFSDVIRNGELDATLFKFSAPDYVDIIGEAQ